MRFGRGLGVEHELHDPGPVTQVDEDEPAMVAAAVNPARDSGDAAGTRGVELSAP
jgi:hypothetical protein